MDMTDTRVITEIIVFKVSMNITVSKQTIIRTPVIKDIISVIMNSSSSYFRAVSGIGTL